MPPRTSFLGLLLLLLGSVNTLISKYQDMTVVGHTEDGQEVYFQHPSVQCGFMFFGEFLCLVPYFAWKWVLKRKRQGGDATDRTRISRMVTSPSELDMLAGRVQPHPNAAANTRCFPFCPSYKTMRKVLAFFIPAVCDAAATIMLYTGLMFTYASTFQMLRATMVLWCGLLTIFCLRRKLHIHHWIGICMIAAGSLLVGASSVLNGDPTEETSSDGESDAAEYPLLGAGLVITGQLLSAIQFVVEERYLAKYHVPALLAVGLEGFWGLILCFVVLPILSVVSATDGLPLDDVPQAFEDIMRIPRLQISFGLNMICIAVFNFLALVVTSDLSSAWRATIDTSRTIIIWSVSVYWFEWEYFHGLQVIGFGVLVAGMSLYNELMRGCLRHTTADDELPIGSSRSVYAPQASNGSGRGVRPPGRVSALQDPLLGDASSPPRSPSHGARGIPSAGTPRSPSGRPPLHPNSFGRESLMHMARSITVNPEVLSPHSIGSYDFSRLQGTFEESPMMGGTTMAVGRPSQDLAPTVRPQIGYEVPFGPQTDGTASISRTGTGGLDVPQSSLTMRLAPQQGSAPPPQEAEAQQPES
mmetsp:Transcript_24077/g.61723  ORF Transcript_24077/g.61723 Transcript_24077/m.61723 type:complete len:585 (-) Transcript_24077:194-1948(-)|eukprot:jgi/Tetstr1/442240/TSEL_030381.t1